MAGADSNQEEASFRHKVHKSVYEWTLDRLLVRHCLPARNRV